MKNIIVLLVLLYFRRKKITYMFWMRNFNGNFFLFFSCRFERVSTWFGSLVMEV